LSTRSRREAARSLRAGRPNQRLGQRSSLVRRISSTSERRRPSRWALRLVGQRRPAPGRALGRHPRGCKGLAAGTRPTGVWSTGNGEFVPNCSSRFPVQARRVRN